VWLNCNGTVSLSKRNLEAGSQEVYFLAKSFSSSFSSILQHHQMNIKLFSLGSANILFFIDLYKD
jgi:hypothetical protein